ncbi:hypothetical protein ACUXV3_01450 [Roseobacteraceae bacterium NS-SX3]
MACLAAAALVSACGSSVSNRTLYDGVAFKVKAKPVDKKATLALFTVEVAKAARSLQGAREAAHHEGTSYCIRNYGTSRIDWTPDPLDPAAPLRMSDGTAVFSGKCDP